LLYIGGIRMTTHNYDPDVRYVTFIICAASNPFSTGIEMSRSTISG